jgi:hypothetical protein
LRERADETAGSALARGLRRFSQEAQSNRLDQRQVASVSRFHQSATAAEVGIGGRVAQATLGGDIRRMRGAPIVAKGVRGVMQETDPLAAVLAAESRRERKLR